MAFRTLVATVALTLGVSGASAQTNVINQNAVGYVKLKAVAGRLLVRYDFNGMDGKTTFTADVFDDLPVGSTVWRYDPASPQGPHWVPNNKSRIPDVGYTWGPTQTQHVITRGEAYLIDASDNTLSNDVYLLGEVPGDAGYAVVASNGFSGYGYPYPAVVDWRDTAMAGNRSVPTGSRAWRYDRDGGWVDSVKEIDGAGDPTWTPWTLGPAPTTELPPGEGILIQTVGGPYPATEVKPYAWP